MKPTLRVEKKAPLRLALAMFCAGAVVACSQNAPIQPFAPRLAKPEPGDVVIAQDVVIVADASGSMDRKEGFPQEKAFLQSFVDGMPRGTYQVAFHVLGGRERNQHALGKFDRFELRRWVVGLGWTGRETPLADILSSYATDPSPLAPQARFIIFNDGLPTRYGKYIGPEETLAAASKLVATAGPGLCIHTIELGDDPRGPKLLEALAASTKCGSSRTLDSLDNPDALYSFQQQVFNGPKPPATPKPKRRVIDLDKDGVDDRFDRCARTPLGAQVDGRGCWVIVDTVFETGSARIRPSQRKALDRALAVLEQNPDLKIRLDGHTDNTGAAKYNFSLAEQRAEAVRRYMVERGISADRLQVRSFGATRPISDNNTPSGRASNRRVELSVLDG